MTKATHKPIQIRMGGYGPATTGFSKSLKLIGDKIEAQFGDRVDIKYIWNIMDLGFKGEDILWLVEHGLLTLGSRVNLGGFGAKRAQGGCLLLHHNIAAGQPVGSHRYHESGR